MLMGVQFPGFQLLLLLLMCLKQVQVQVTAQQSVLPEAKGTTLFYVPTHSTEKPCKEWFHGRNISLSDRSLDEFPQCLPGDTETLDLSNNNLTTITQPQLLKLSQLQRLVLKNNQIQEIYCRSDVLQNLQYLDLSSNSLSDVPRCSNLPKLQWLSLARNPISKIYNFAFISFPSLVFLNLSYTEVGKSGPGDPRPLSFVHKKTLHMSFIQILDLSGTYLSDIHFSWSFSLKNLKELYLRNMINIKTLEVDFTKQFPRLQLLSCAHSSALTSVSSSLFEGGSHLKYIDFEKANETLCRQENGLEVSLVQLHDGCQINPSPYDADNTAMSLNGSVLSTSTARTHPHETVSIDSATLTQKVEKNTDIITVFKQTPSSSGSLNRQRPSSATQATTLQSELITGPTRSFGKSESTRQFPGTSSFTPATSTITRPVGEEINQLPLSTKTNIPVPEKLTEVETFDYYEYDTKPTATVKSPSRPCDYNPCRHLQTPCYELQHLAPCSCPGLSGDHVLPFPPRIQGASEVTDTSAQVHWCSPNSEVRKYQLIYHPKGDNNQTVVDNIYVTSRKYTLYNLAPDTTYHICAVSFNKAGSSRPLNDEPSRSPCTTFRTKPSYVGILAALCTVAGVATVGIVILSVCLYKACRNNLVNQYDTRLVSYKNPAFEYQLNIPSYN